MTMKMAWCDAAPLGIINPVSSFSSHPFASSFSQLSGLRVNREHKYVTVIGSRNSKRHSINVTRSVLGNRNFSVDNSENVATDSLRILLYRFFAQTQKLEELSTSEGMQIGFEYETFESGLQAALREKEEDLKDAESRVLLGRAEISRAKQELEHREKEIAAAYVKQEKIKEDLKQANHDFARLSSEEDRKS
ncbi:hypothetical protein IFM89_000102 [Coptis chinensis]|uniref:Uncharacterized protein n=1 Tax=Coptis chinensis TaxID=261450 RepID=A0A835HX31_9MAGN|nr:hypothetical protein IFM89_000102 [Coptis chinensis]